MPIDLDKLVAFQIPTVTQKLRPEDLAFYSLSVGLGALAHDPVRLRFLDVAQVPVMNPAMALVIAEPAGWLDCPEAGVNGASALHLNQWLQILQLPTAGEEITSHTRIADVFDKGAGRAALIEVTTDLRSGRGLLVRRGMTIFVRNGGGFGGRPPTSRPGSSDPMTIPDWQIDLPTRPEQALLYRLNGDLNPLHCDPTAAALAGFDAPILHGLCTLGIAIHAVLSAVTNYDPYRIREVSARFALPVYPGETIRTEIWREGRFLARVVDRDVIVLNDGRFAT